VSFEVITRCPVCSSNLRATRLKCKGCGTVIENDFEFSKLAYLSNEQLRFIEVFIKCRGNIKEVEKELGISYPTVRAKLDEVIGALGYSVAKQREVNNKEVMDLLEKGEITAEQAINMLKD
jgi:hypothetical protein